MQTHGHPVIIGGSGGSGTRVFAMVCVTAGYDMGTRLNASYDALDFTAFYDKWINPYLLKHEFPLTSTQKSCMKVHFQACLSKYQTSIQRLEKWGWKNPRSMFLLPFFDSFFTSLKFIHVVRDGRDMAYSQNQNQLGKHGLALLDPEHRNLPLPLQSITFWSKANMAVAKYGENVMGERYIRCRFEDIFFEPSTAFARLSAFLQTPIENFSPLIKQLSIPSSIGRWQTIQTEEQKALLEIGRSGLKYFGYIDANS